MGGKQKLVTRNEAESRSRKVGILLPGRVHSVYEQIARAEHITVSQVIARVAIEFVEIEREASRSRQAIVGKGKEAIQRKSRLFRRTVVRRQFQK